MNQRIKKVGLSLLLAVSLVPLNSAFAEEGLRVVEKKTYEVEGETFEVVTSKDEHGTLTYTVPTDVINKEAVAEFVSGLADTSSINPPSISPLSYGPYPWSDTVQGTDRSGTVTWDIGGSNKKDLLNKTTMTIKNGRLKAVYTASGTADSIVVAYDYTFSTSGLTLEFPFLKTEKDKVSWTSEPVENTWLIDTTTHGGEASTYFLMNNAKLEARADIYKGINIFRPVARKTVTPDIN